jgi:4-carboxymuconolactone decarboxylase
MSQDPLPAAVEPTRQGFSDPWQERLAVPAVLDDMSLEQREVAQALLNGPRKGIYGPFLPLLHSPGLLERVGKVGEYLRFDSQLVTRIRELVMCAVARHVTNQFEWTMHAPLAVQAGVAEATIEFLRVGARPRDLPADEEAALDFVHELLHRHGTSEPTFAAARACFGDAGVVELTTLIGYFAMVSWLMNVAHTPAQAGATGAALQAFPL